MQKKIHTRKTKAAKKTKLRISKAQFIGIVVILGTLLFGVRLLFSRHSSAASSGTVLTAKAKMERNFEYLRANDASLAESEKDRIVKENEILMNLTLLEGSLPWGNAYGKASKSISQKPDLLSFKNEVDQDIVPIKESIAVVVNEPTKNNYLDLISTLKGNDYIIKNIMQKTESHSKELGNGNVKEINDNLDWYLKLINGGLVLRKQ